MREINSGSGKNSTFTISSQEEGMLKDAAALPPLPDGLEGMALFTQKFQAALDAQSICVLQKAEEIYSQLEKEFEEVQSRLEQTQALLKAERESLAVLNCSYEKEAKSGAEVSERKKQLAELLRQQLAQLRSTEHVMVDLARQLKEAEAKIKSKSDSANNCIGALKVLIKTFDDSLHTKVKRNEETGLIDVSFLVANSKGEKVKFPISLKEVGPGKYDAVNPSPALIPFVEKLHQTNNITAFLYDVKEYAKVFVKNNE